MSAQTRNVGPEQIQHRFCRSSFVLVPAKNVIPLRVTPPTPGSPLDTPTWSKLAAIPLTFITAFGILDTLDLRHGEVLLIRGGTSSIGLAICTVAKCIGAMVASTTRDPTNAPNLSDNGADYVILEREGGIKDDVRMMFPARDISGPTDEFASAPVNRDIAGADKCVDLIGTPSTLLDSLQALKAPGGIYCIAGTLGGTAVIPLFDPLSQIPSGVMITTFSTDKIDLQRVPLQQIVDRCLERGQYRISLDRTFLIEDVDKVAGYIREGKSRGKVVVVVNDELS